MPTDNLIIGCNGYVSAIDPKTGEEVWRTKLRDGLLGGSRGMDVSVLLEGNQVFVGCHGRIYSIDALTGSIMWSNELKGMGYNEVALARQGNNTQFITRTEHTSTTTTVNTGS
ncbi:MAG: PQQ-binding-like beta-propeller repeat protein [Chitinophagaceae bacterium]